MKTIQAYKGLNGHKYFSKTECIQADRETLVQRKVAKCRHLLHKKIKQARRDVGHHDWKNYEYTIYTCEKCPFSASVDDNELSQYFMESQIKSKKWVIK